MWERPFWEGDVVVSSYYSITNMCACRTWKVYIILVNFANILLLKTKLIQEAIKF